MKKLALGLIVFTFGLAISLSAMAGTPTPTGVPLPGGSVEHEAWEWVEDHWVSMGSGILAANARAWSSNPVVKMCNKIYWQIPVKVHASVAQWVEWSLSGSRYDWRVRKPGTYAANSLTAVLKSNSDLEFDFEGFENLKYQGSGQFPGVKQEIETWYAYGEADGLGALSWIPAAALNAKDCLVKDSEDLHEGLSVKLWNKIMVDECNSACEYEDDATITLVLQNCKIWIDPETGNFAK
jgi:hypothetical protein